MIDRQSWNGFTFLYILLKKYYIYINLYNMYMVMKRIFVYYYWVVRKNKLNSNRGYAIDERVVMNARCPFYYGSLVGVSSPISSSLPNTE